MFVHYDFLTETGYRGCGTVWIESPNAPRWQIQIAAFADAKKLGYHNVQAVYV